MSYSYLASPYSHPAPIVRELRYREAMRCFRWLLKQRLWTYSPIVQCHELVRLSGIPFDAGYWSQYNHAMLSEADQLLILTLDGWSESRGVADEITMSHSIALPIRFIHPKAYAITEEP